MKKILTVVGARPQFIKASALSRIVSESNDFKEVIVHTGQHFDQNMSEIFFEELNISKPDYNLGIGGSSHGEMTGRQLEALENVMVDEQPDCVIVYGDTNSTLAGAIAAAKLNITLVHIEAGLRSHNRKMPEEINRILTDHASDILFTPTDLGAENLINEGITNDKIFNVGDVMYDASIFFSKKAVKSKIIDDLNIDHFVLATIHRAENTDNPERLEKIFKGLSKSTIPVILPLHPRTKSCLEEFNIKLGENINLIEPVGYLEMIWLESNCQIICTDSGGVQKEAYFFKKPCITMRDETEWIELVDSGWNTLVGASEQKISSKVNNFDVPKEYRALYGEGNAANMIIDILKKNV